MDTAKGLRNGKKESSMSTSAQVEQPRGDSFKMLRAMVGIGILCALMIVLTFEGTLPIIEVNKAEALQKAIFRVLPDITDTRPFHLNANGEFVAGTAEDAAITTVYAGYSSQGEFAGLAIEASGQGYADIIRILYGYDPDQEAIVGFYVLESKETPGLGDKIEKDPAFLANFEALDVSLASDGTMLAQEVVMVKSGTKTNAWEIDAITGATISSRAITEIIGTSMAEMAPKIVAQKETFSQPATE